MNKNKNGFTLIELLVTIVIMLTILGIAIVSFVNVSKRKKIEAYEEVKEQMELAGEQYFENNRYLFEGLEDGSSGSISLGKLIDDGYLNKVTDPRDGKSFSYCTKIDVIIKDGVFDTEVNEGTYGASDNKTDCENDSSVEVTEPGAPKIEVTANGTKGDNDWYVSNVTIEAKADTNGNGTLKNLKGVKQMVLMGVLILMKQHLLKKEILK